MSRYKPLPNALREALGASPGRPGSAFGWLLGTLGLPGASPDRPWGVICVSKSRLERVRTRPRNDFGRPNQPKIDFSLIWGRFGTDFRRFSKIFRRFSPALRATKAQNRISERSRAILVARLGPCVTQSLRTACTSFEMACKRYVFSLFFVAYPQVHLVLNKTKKEIIFHSFRLRFQY